MGLYVHDGGSHLFFLKVSKEVHDFNGLFYLSI